MKNLISVKYTFIKDINNKKKVTENFVQKRNCLHDLITNKGYF